MISDNLRVSELEDICKNLDPQIHRLLKPTFEDMAFMEGEIIKLRGMPFIRINPDDPSQQKATPASKLYKELKQQYNNCLKIVISAFFKTDDVEDTPLRAFFKQRAEKVNNE